MSDCLPLIYVLSIFHCRMLDENFEDQLNDIIKLCPKSRQTMLFSATMTDQVCSNSYCQIDRNYK